jgi:amino acid transporter
VVSALAILVFALPGTFIYAVKFTVITRLLVFASTCVALPILRRRAKTGATLEDAPSSFEVPGGPFIAALCVFLCLWLLANSGWVEIRDVSIATAIGMIVYAAMQLSQRKG